MGGLGWLAAGMATTVTALAGGSGPPPTGGPSGPPEDPPALTVVVVVDQMPVHLLERFDDLFTGGLRRLLDRGAVFTRARHAHAIPHTSPGHATLATGAYPSSHGIVANNWWDREGSREDNAVADPGAPILGLEEADGGRSPAHMRRPTLGDALRSTHPGARIVSVAGKDRSAILLAGDAADGAFWYHTGSGRFLGSAHYVDALPPWVEEFNASGRARELAGDSWRLLAEEDVYARSRPDSAAFENWRGGSSFAHPAPADAGEDGWAEALAFSPRLDELIFELAERAVEAEELGADDVPDILWVGASASDFVGHLFGPWSREVQDQMLRLDRRLGHFLDFLDEHVGRGEYVLALSADHGSVAMPEEARLRGLDARRVAPEPLRDALRAALDSAGPAEGVEETIPAVLAYLGVYVEWPEALAAAARARIRSAVAHRLRGVPRIVDAVTEDELAAHTPGATPRDGRLLDVYRRSLHPPRSPDVFVRTGEHDLLASREGITAHLSPYDADRRVPLVVAGPGVRPGRYGRDVATADLAPTLARLLAVELPEADGRLLHEALEKGAGTQVRGPGMVRERTRFSDPGPDGGPPLSPRDPPRRR